MTRSGWHSVLVPVLTSGGAVGAVASVGGALAADRLDVLPAVGLAGSWYVAGWVATRARPDHPEASLLLGVGALHLGAFGASAAAATVGAGGWAPWLGEATAGLLFAAGFAALALLLALYPDGRAARPAQRFFLRAVAAATVLAGLVPPFTSQGLAPTLAVGTSSVPAPPGLPLVRWDLDLFSVVPPLLVVAGLVLLVVTARRTEPRHRAVHTWPAGAGGMLVLLLLATPSAVRLVGPDTWSVVFVVAAAALPWALVAGLTRYRLLAVDLQVTRSLARGALAVSVLSCYGVAAALLDRTISPAVAVAVALVAALTGDRVRRMFETVADRLVTGGRVRRAAAEAELRHAGMPSDLGELADQVVATVARVLEVSWVRLLQAERVVAAAGHPDDRGHPQLSVPVEAGGEVLGCLQCGPRHGGWAAEQERWVREVADRLGLLWQNARLSRALAERVSDLEASRRRLVRAEEEARRRLERDLHDGLQQQLVALLVRLELLRALLPPDGRPAEVTASAHELAAGSLAGLRELVRGIRPPVLADRGLVAALQSRVAQLPVPVTVDADPRFDGSRFAADVEGAAYFVALEALTNVLKHAGGSAARVVVTPAEDGLVVTVGDDGRGFEEPGEGTGLAGMRDRVEALGGTLSVTSAVGVGTTVTAHLPGERSARA